MSTNYSNRLLLVFQVMISFSPYRVCQFSVVTGATLSLEENYYALRMARYPDARAEDMRRRQVELERSTAWAIARNEEAARVPLNLPYSSTSPEVVGYRCVITSGDT